MPTALDPIHIYVDGSASPKTDRGAYGWVVANPTPAMTRARAVMVEKNDQTRRPTGMSTAMEAAAFIDAVWEFAPRNRHMVVHGDCEFLPTLIQKYREGVVASDAFFDKPKALRHEDAWKLLRVLDSASFEFQWVKGHSGDFLNSVTDQMLRIITADGHSEVEARAFAEQALASGTARIWDTIFTRRDRSDAYKGYREIVWAEAA